MVTSKLVINDHRKGISQRETSLPAEAVRVRLTHVPLRSGLVCGAAKRGRELEPHVHRIHVATIDGASKPSKPLELHGQVADAVPADGISPDGLDERIVEVVVHVLGSVVVRHLVLQDVLYEGSHSSQGP
jgi:hypothetical protein